MRPLQAALVAAFLLELLMVRPVNAAAVAIADASEGCVLHAYRDPAGILTAGYGHTGPDVRAGMEITRAQADAWRAADMARAAAFVEAHVRLPLNDNQFSALAEFTYNVGVGNFLGSTLLRRLNKGDFASVPTQLLRWNKAGGKVLPGLMVRRQREAALFGGPVGDGSKQAGQSIIASVPAATDSFDAATNSLETPTKPQPPTLIERIRAWLAGADRLPLPAQ